MRSCRPTAGPLLEVDVVGRLHAVGMSLTLVAILSIAAMACSDSSQPLSAGPAPRGESTAPIQARDPDAIRTELARTANSLGTATFTAVYDFAGKALAGDAAGTVALAAKPPKRLFSIETTTAGRRTTIITIDDGTWSYLCTDTGATACTKAQAPDGGGGAIPPGLDVGAIVERIAASNASTVSDAPGQRIANRDGRCYRIEGTDAGSGILCVSPGDGLLLLLDGTFGGGRITLRAREISNSPADVDFLPPYPIVEGGPG